MLQLLKLTGGHALWVGERGNVTGFRDNRDQKLLALTIEVVREQADPGRVAAGMRHRGDKSRPNHVTGDREDRQRHRCLLRGLHCGRPNGDDDIDLGLDQSGRSARELFGAQPKPALIDDQVLAFDKAERPQRIKQERGRAKIARIGGQTADAINPPSLRGEGGARQQHRRGAGENAPARLADAAAHSITSSARCSSGCGTVRPSALAVLRLITSSNVVGCCTGRSAGFSPLRIFPA